MAKVLVADDEHAICQAFSQFLAHEGHTPLIASSGREALDVIDREGPEAVFLDVQMPGMNGLEALQEIHQRFPTLPVVVMTAYGTMQTAMEAMRNGAFDYLTKPVDLQQIRSLLERALRTAKAVSPSAPPAADISDEGPVLVGSSPAMQEMFKLMGLLTTNELTVLLTGESGVGKELVARAIHDHSERRDRPFIAVNCAAVPENLIESELFGHERGAFTGAENRRIGRFEAARDGTLFLDEIGELSIHLQSKLLRVLQERSFERVGSIEPQRLQARIIAATNRDLENEISASRFREDLYYRLKMVTLLIPPLRKRREDIEALAYHFLALSNRELGRDIRHIEPAALERMQQHRWPGNVRELEHTIKRAALLARGDTLSTADIDIEAPPLAQNVVGAPEGYTALFEAACAALHLACKTGSEQAQGQGIFHALVAEVEHELVAEALRMSGGNQVAAAKLLGLHRTTMRKKRRPPRPE